MEPEAPAPVVETATVEANEAANKALASVTDLIVATLKENVPQRFSEAQRLCEVAQALTKARARRAADFKNGEAQDMAFAARQVQMAINQGVAQANFNVVANNAGGANAINYVLPPVQPAQEMMMEPAQYIDMPDGGRRRVNGPGHLPNGGYLPPGQVLFDNQGNLVNERGIVYAGHLDANALMRHMLMAFGPHAQTGAEANRARVASEEAVELEALGKLLPKATGHWQAILERRIKQLMTNMEIRSDAKPVDEVRAVPPDDPRGHPPDAGGAQADDAPRVGANGVGEQGNGGAPPARPVDVVGQVAVV